MASTKKQCPTCDSQLSSDANFCSVCGISLNVPKSRYSIIPDYPFRTQGPHKTHFPLVPRNRWKFNDLIPRESILWTPALNLGAGEYDVALVTPREDIKLEEPLSIFTSIADLGAIRPSIFGQDISPENRLRFSIIDPGQVLQIGVQCPTQIKLSELGLLLLPRLGLFWSAKDLSLAEVENDGKKVSYGSLNPEGLWEVKATDFHDHQYVVNGPDIVLGLGDYEAIVRLSCANWASKHAQFIAIEIFAYPETEKNQDNGETLAKVYIGAGDFSEPGSMQDIVVPFDIPLSLSPHVNRETPSVAATYKIACRIYTRHPVDVTIDHLRICTPEDLINERYYELGGIDSVLGPPLGAAFIAAPSFEKTRGWLKRYQAGAIYWSNKFGAREVYDQIGFKYEHLGGTASLLGFPSSYPEQVTSNYGTKGLKQRFERYSEFAAIYAGDFPWGRQGYAVYGGIAEGTYFRTLLGHKGELGLPISDEYTVEQTEQGWIRRSDFEGGAIEWVGTGRNWESWEEKQIIYWPRPRITGVKIPAWIYAEDAVEIGIEAKNLGGPAKEGYINLSFPDGAKQELESVVASSGKTITSYPPDVSKARYGSESGKPLEYPRAEAIISKWEKDESHWLSVKATPLRPGKFHIYARVTMRNPRYKELGYHFDGDPSPVDPKHLDQQGENVYVYEVEVKERPRPELSLDISLPETLLYQGFDDTLDITVKNIGTGIAHDIVIRANAAFGDNESELIKNLEPGESVLVQLEITPSRLGKVLMEFKVVCQDQFGSKWDYSYKSRTQVFPLHIMSLDSEISRIDTISVLEKRLAQLNENLLALEEKEAEFVDTRNLTLDHEKAEQRVKSNIEKLQLRITELRSQKR